jgi:transcriptional regulator with XRE-family HTH domain
MNRIIGQNIKKMRILKNISQSILAKDMGYSQANWSKIENGKIAVSAFELYKISLYFKENIEIFFDERQIKKDDILFNLVEYGIDSFISNQRVTGDKILIEKLIIDILKNPKNPRYLECLPYLIYKNFNTIDFNNVIEECYTNKIQNRLGMILEILIIIKKTNNKLIRIYDKISALKILKEDSFFFSKKLFDILKPISSEFAQNWLLHDRFDLNSFKRHFV